MTNFNLFGLIRIDLSNKSNLTLIKEVFILKNILFGKLKKQIFLGKRKTM